MSVGQSPFSPLSKVLTGQSGQKKASTTQPTDRITWENVTVKDSTIVTVNAP